MSAGGWGIGGILGCAVIGFSNITIILQTSITNCINIGDVFAGEICGGIVGRLYPGSANRDHLLSISNSINSGYVRGGTHAGGIIGYFENVTTPIIENTHNTGLVESAGEVYPLALNK